MTYREHRLRRLPEVVHLALLVTILLGFISPVRAQTTYYVSTGGNNVNDGLSQTTAFATIQTAADKVEPGDTVQVLAGTYTGFFVDSRSGTAAERIVFSADPGVFIQGEGANACQRHETVCLWESNYITVEGFDIAGRDCGYGLP